MPETSRVSDLRANDPRSIAGYTVLRRLGSGGQGVVFLAVTRDGAYVAIKQLLSGPDDERAKQQFAKEVSAARRVGPFCTARVLDADLDSAEPYVVSEYIQGLSLQQHVRDHGPMRGGDLQALAIGTLTALAAIHRAGVVHRDLKPANVMLAADGPRVIDFGVARDLSTETTVTSRVFGTPAYMAPEQLRAQRVGPAADLFAWASVIAFAATGRVLFDAEHMMAVVYRITSEEPDLDGVPPELRAVLTWCLAKDPADRPSAEQLLGSFLGQVEGDVLTEATVRVRADWHVDAGPPPTGVVRAVPRRGRRRLWPLVAVGLVAAGAGAGLAVLQPWSDDDSGITAGPVPGSTGTGAEVVNGSVGVRAEFAGTWTGEADQKGADVSAWTVEIRLEEGDLAGKLSVPELGCSGSLMMESYDTTMDTYTFSQSVYDEDGNQCVSTGDVSLAAIGTDRASFTWLKPEGTGSDAYALVERE